LARYNELFVLDDFIVMILKKSIDPLLPRGVASGDSIGIVAPGSPFDKIKFEKGISVLAEMGFRPIFTDELFLKDGYLAGPDLHRARILNEAFLDDQIKAIWCARGGYGSLRMLKHLDFDMIYSHPKIFIGCSDISAILNVLYLRCNMVSFHGPMIESLGAADHRTQQSVFEAISSRQLWALRPERAVVIHHGISSGRVTGGNLTTLCHLIGTPFQPDFSGTILLLEDTGEAPYRVDRMLSQMKMAGCFEGVTGMILGSFEKCGEIDQIYNIFQDIFSDSDFPILAGFDIGHGQPNVTIPFGLDAKLDTEAGELAFQQLHLRFDK